MSIRYYEVSIDFLKDQLKIVLEKLHNLVIAVLFGSVLKRRIGKGYRCWSLLPARGRSGGYNQLGWNT